MVNPVIRDRPKRSYWLQQFAVFINGSSSSNNRKTSKWKPWKSLMGVVALCSCGTIYLSTKYNLLLLRVDDNSLLNHTSSHFLPSQQQSSITTERRSPFLRHPSHVQLVFNETSTKENGYADWNGHVQPIKKPPKLSSHALEAVDRTTKNKIDQSVVEEALGTCINMGEWQTSVFPSCNKVHEINMRPETGSLVFINCGGNRCAFKISDDMGEAVLKVSKYKHDFGPSKYNAARKDGVAMERLTRSDYVLDIFGYCGLSQVIELGGSAGSIHDLIKTTRLKEKMLSPVESLKLAYQITSSVADMHGISDDPNLVPITHNDLCCHQFIYVNGVYKLNDFHMSKFQQMNKDTHRTCLNANGYSKFFIVLRSPEEIIDTSMKKHLEKSDVYTMANVLFYVLTMKWLCEDYNVEDSKAMISTGTPCPFPDDITQHPHEAVQAVKKAIEWAWTFDPIKRPRAEQIRDVLRSALQKELGLTRDLNVEDIRVKLDPLPKNYRYTESDFYSMLR